MTENAAAEDAPGGTAAAAEIPSPVLLAGMVRQAWGLYVSNLGALFLAFLPFVALTAAIFFGIVASVTLKADNVLFLILVRDLIRIVMSSLGVAAAVILVADRLAGRPGSVRASLRETIGFAPTIVLGALLAVLPYIVTFFMFGPYMAPLLRGMFVGPPIVITAIVLERRALRGALSRARELLDLNWSRMLLYLITVAAGVGLVDFLIQWGLQGVSAGAGDVVTYSLAVVVSVLVPAIVLPFVACVWLIAYFDLRARAEDFDRPAMIALRQSPPTR
jgi:hypothetical protein